MKDLARSAGSQDPARRQRALRIEHVVPHIDEEASGPSYSVPRLCQALAAQGHAVGLNCLAAQGRVDGVALRVYPQWPILRSLAVSPALARGIGRLAREVDIVHNHSLWSMANMAAGWVVPGRNARLVVSPRGTVSSWALGHSRRVKALAWPVQRRALTRADLLHATSLVERDELRALGLRSPIVVIPNGIDVPASAEPPVAKFGRTLLFLSRIHPKKGIDTLLQAWAKLEAMHPDWSLVVAGKGDVAHVAHVEQLALGLGLKRVMFPGALYGDAKAATYANADLFVLPTHSENFGMVVAEALAHGCPAVVTQGAPWQGLDAHRCGWWIEPGGDALFASLDAAMRLPIAERHIMGANGRAWMQQEFGWEAIARRMARAYAWIVDGGPPTEDIHPWQ